MLTSALQYGPGDRNLAGNEDLCLIKASVTLSGPRGDHFPIKMMKIPELTFIYVKLNMFLDLRFSIFEIFYFTLSTFRDGCSVTTQLPGSHKVNWSLEHQQPKYLGATDFRCISFAEVPPHHRITASPRSHRI